MTASLTVEVESHALERVRADVLVVGVAPMDRPLRGAAGYADWRLFGELWKLVSSGRIVGLRGDAALVLSGAGLQTRQILVLGLGPRRSLDISAWQEIGRDAIDRSIDLRAETVALAIGRDGQTGPQAAHQPFVEATMALLCGAERAVSTRGARLRLLLPGTPTAVLEDASIPAGVEVRGPGSRFSPEIRPAPAGMATPDSRRV